MGKFIKYLFIFLFPILLVGIFSEVLIRQIPNDYKHKRKYLDDKASQIRTLFLGNSHIYYGINPKYIDSSFNASYISQSYDYDLALLRKYENQWSNLKFIVIPVDYFSFYTRIETGIEAWRIKNYRIYYNINIDHKFNNTLELLGNKLPVNITRLNRFYVEKINDISSTNLGWGKNYSSKEKHDLKESGKMAAERHRAINNLSFIENVKLLSEIISFAENKNIKVILITSPTYHTYIENLDKKQLNITLSTVNELITKHQKAKYYNMLQDSSFVSNDFYDADHLNEIGAKKFSLKIDSLIKLNALK